MRDVCLDCFKPPASRSRAAKHSDFGCLSISGVVIGSALSKGWFSSRGFLRGSLFKTWPKPETAHEKPLAPRIHRRHFAGKPVVASVNVDCFLRLSFLSKCHMIMMRCTSYLQHAQNKQLPYMTYPLPEMCSFPLYLTWMKGKPRVADLTENFTF